MDQIGITLFGLAAVDRMQGGRAARRLYQGWAGWESATGRKVRRAASAALLALATRLAPAEERPGGAQPGLVGTPQA